MASRVRSSFGSMRGGVRPLVVLTALLMVVFTLFVPSTARATEATTATEPQAIDFVTAPYVTEPTCDAPGSLVLAPVYDSDPYVVTVDPSYSAGDTGNFTVVYAAKDGYYFEGQGDERQQSVSFDLTVAPQKDCNSEPPADPEPPVVDEPEGPVGQDVVWSGKHGQEHANPACDYGQASQFHFVLAPKQGVKFVAPGTLTVTFADGTKATSNGDLKANGAVHFYVDGANSAVAASAVVTGATWTGNGSPQLVLSDSACLGDAVPQPEPPTSPEPPVGEEPVVDPLNPGITAFSKSCVMQGQRTGVIEGSVGNPNETPMTYTVVLEGGHKSYSREISVVGFEAASFTFGNLSAGTYTVRVTGADGTGNDSTTVVVQECTSNQPPTNPGPPMKEESAEPVSPDKNDFVVEPYQPNCFMPSASVAGEHKAGGEIAVALEGRGADGTFVIEDSIENPQGGFFYLAGHELQPGESRDYIVTSTFLDDSDDPSDNPPILEFSVTRPSEAECEIYQPLPVEQQVTVSAECGEVTFANNADEAVAVLYGSYSEAPDGQIVIEPGKSERVETTRSQLDWAAYTIENYRFAGESGGTPVMVPQDCDVTPQPEQPGTSNPIIQQPVTNVTVKPVVKVNAPVNVVVPRFASPSNERPVHYGGPIGKRYQADTGIEGETADEVVKNNPWVLLIAALIALGITGFFAFIHRSNSGRGR